MYFFLYLPCAKLFILRKACDPAFIIDLIHDNYTTFSTCCIKQNQTFDYFLPHIQTLHTKHLFQNKCGGGFSLTKSSTCRNCIFIEYIYPYSGFKNIFDHRSLVHYVKSVIGDLMAPPYYGWSTSLNNLWNIDKRIIVAYNDVNTVKDLTNDVWWPVSQKWANKRSVDDLHQYFDNIYQK